ncbi:MAG: acylphosphatase [Bradymonadales bacterium]|nr:acylphosphatase [Bradymonadales bacterium]
MTIARHLLISGLVQGVFYRATTAREANQLGLDGWVRNLPDGRVEVWAQGDQTLVTHLEQWCRQGPTMARVESVQAESPQPDPRFEGRGFVVRVG